MPRALAFLVALLGGASTSGAAQLTFNNPILYGLVIGTKYPASPSTAEDTARRFCQDHGFVTGRVAASSVRGTGYVYLTGAQGTGLWASNGSTGVTVIDSLVCHTDEVVYLAPALNTYVVGTKQPANGAGSTPAETADRFCREYGHAGAASLGTSVRGTAYSYVNGPGGVGAWTANGSADVTVLDRIGCVPRPWLATGGNHSCAVTDAYGLRCWGQNIFGQVGDGSSLTRTAPVDVLGLTAGVESVAAGHGHTCAVVAGGAVRCWGLNGYGQLGDTTTISRPTPAPVAGLPEGAVMIAAGYESTCALTRDGGVKCWGDNTHGQLGDGTNLPRTTPVPVLGLTSGVRAVSAGHGFACALTLTGAVKCWGDNRNAQLGGGTANQHRTPIDVHGLSSGVAALSAGSAAACALTTAGAVRCWGANLYGELGDGTTTLRPTPVTVLGLASGVAAISAGNNSTCALTLSGGMTCWGFNGYSNLGDNSRIPRSTPVDVFGLASGVAYLGESNGSHTCVRSTGDRTLCWGHNGNGELGDGTQRITLIPVPVTGM